MSSSLPVPSKAALTALRGLVVGTSCTLALVAEDRRRRINNAVRAIENGEKIKSARKYRAGSAALALAMEEEALWDPGLAAVSRASLDLHPKLSADESVVVMPGAKEEPGSKNMRGQLGRQGGSEGVDVAGLSEAELLRREAVAGSGQGDVANTSSAGSVEAELDQSNRPVRAPTVSPIRPLPKMTPPRRSGPSWLRDNMETVKAYAFPTSDDIVARMHDACETRDSRKLVTTVHTAIQAMDHRIVPDNLDRPWMEATARLCRTCQEEGRLDEAAALLCRVLRHGPLEESAYLGHEPFAMIESLLARADLSGHADKAFGANLNLAISVFVPRFVERPTGSSPQVYSLGRKLLELCFSAHRLQRIFTVYRRCSLVAGDDSAELASWFFAKLFEVRDYKSVVKLFVTTFAQSAPTQDSLHAVGDLVVDSVELACHHRPDEVLKTLQSVCASLGTTRLNPKWVIKLLSSQWKRSGNFREVEALFEQLHTPTLGDSVQWPENIYRIMVELALEAGDKAKADAYFKLAVAQNSELASDVRLLGVFARFQAAEGDWGAVRATFEAMDRGAGQSARTYGQVFVPVLKAYAETHTVRETEMFLKLYTEEFEVPLCDYTVTLMAKHYAAIRDVHSLIEWLDYCSRAGFAVDAAFTNSILVRCRRQWNFPFRQLRTLFRKLRALSPDFVDKHTEQVMADAAWSDSKYMGKAATGRLLSLRIDPSRLPVQGRLAHAEDVVLAMKKALAGKSPRRALAIYRRSVHLNVPFSQHTLRLAVQAKLQAAPDDYSGAFQLIRHAQARGEDVTSTINYVLGQQLSSLAASADPGEAEDVVQSMLAQYQQAGLQLTEASLHRAAGACLAARHFGGAIRYALQAAQARGLSSAGPCFNLQNFRILLEAYASLVDVDGLRDTVARGLARPYRKDTACRSALRHARKWIMHSRARPVSLEERMLARRVVDEGIAHVVETRKRLRAEGRKLEAAAVRIMKQAAKEAGRDDVDLDEIPWLGGGKAAGKADDHFEELERTLLEGPGRTAVEAF